MNNSTIGNRFHDIKEWGMDKSSKQLEHLKKKQDQLKAKIQTLEAAEKSRERKRETRRKILVGAYYLDKAREENTLEQLKTKLNDYLKRDTDRGLFGLKPLEDLAAKEA